jgi:hypothetical protein
MYPRALCGSSFSSPAVRQQPIQPAPGAELLHRPLDQILDVNVRDGLVYYRALKGERGRLDRYVASLNVTPATYQGWSKAQQMAFWVNAYNAFVMQTVINHYPMKGTIKQIPARSTRPRGARREDGHARSDREDDPARVQGAAPLPRARPRRVGSGRLRSEAYTGDRLDAQLADIQSEFVNDRHMYRLDRLDQHDRRHADPELARGGVRRRLATRRIRCSRSARRSSAPDRVRHAAPAAVGEGVRPEERVQDDVPRDGLALNDLTGGEWKSACGLGLMAYGSGLMAYQDSR